MSSERNEDVKMNILVVDDDATTRNLFSQLLSKDGHLTTTSHSGHDALDKIKDSNFDLALVDLKMPGIDGIEVLKEIRTKRPTTQVVIVTGYGTVETAVEALKIGAFDYIEKPFKIQKIRKIIEGIVLRNGLDPNTPSENKPSIVPIYSIEGCYNVFKNSVEDGGGLCITSRDKSTLKDRFGIKRTPILKLSNSLITDDDENKTLSKIRSAISEFNNVNKDSMVLIDGFEFFAKYFSWSELNDFVLDISNELSKNNSKMLLYVNSHELQPSDIEQMKQLVCDVTISIGLNISSSAIEVDIIQFISKNGDSTFNRIFKNLNINQSSKLSFHLQKLQNEGVVQKNGKLYHLEPKGEIILRTLNYFNDATEDKYQTPISIVYNKQ